MPILKADRIIIDREFTAKTVSDVFLKYRAELIADLRESLINVNRDQPGDLLQSIDARITVQSSKVSFEILMNDYWQFVDEGVDGTITSQGSQFKYKKNGKRIPLDAMKKFIAARGLRPKQLVTTGSKKVSKAKKQTSIDSFAWALGISLKRKGIKPTHFFTNVVNEDLKARLTKDISEALKKDIELTFTTE